MGDQRSHLEKMGRELKCPICLSLLSSAASLACNHVFCNACIVKSMKSGSNCPVCKVPYRRREIRAAPHMDNLVSVYKSMEVASGINIFVTQNEPSTKSSDKEKWVQGDPICVEQVTGGCQDKVENQGTSKGKRLRRTSKATVEPSGPVCMKPSCPTKKRVQVAQYPLPETPSQPGKLEGGTVKNTTNELKSSSVVIKENPGTNKEGTVFSPFFWLRDDEGREKSSQHTEADAYITPPEVPSFSDLKDTEDISSTELSPTAEVHGKSDGLDFFESEIFEWTQRACSPELLPSPVKTQVADTEENGKKLEAALWGSNTDVDLSNENATCVNFEQGNGNVNEGNCKALCPRNTNPNNISENGKLNKRGRKANGTAQKKCAKRDTNKGTTTPATSNEESESFVQKQTNVGNAKSSQKSSNRNKKVGRGTCAMEPIPDNVLAASVRTEIIYQHGKNIVSDLPNSLGKKQGSDEDLHFMRTGKKCWKINSQTDADFCTKSKRRKVDSTEVNMLEKVSMVQKKTDKDAIPQPSLIPTCEDADKKKSVLKGKTTKTARKIKTSSNSKCDKESRWNKRMKASFSGISKDGLVEDNKVREGYSSAAIETQSPDGVRGSSDIRVLDDSSKEKELHKTQRGALRKCDTLAHKIQCSFCHSSENSEASGEMVHYYNGKPVSVDYNGGSKIIHSHRKCTEWAPNVYFEDDTVINLEAELARSRRIKCCCCGLKGAALGCYEKTCRKSFHVSCAKLILQCRWDTDNFVMLCPLHASSNLPNENPGSQESRKKCISKIKLLTQHNQVAVKSDISTNSWQSLQNKLVLCCSALTVGEKEIISDFERISKVTLLKKWDSNVTHIIASTDENGACKRTLKYLMGILEGKWILDVNWVKACMTAMKPVDEEQFEIIVDVHGMRNGPQLGRLRVLSKQQKLFDGLKFYPMGGFESSYKGYLQDLIVAAGGTVLHRKPISSDQGALLSGSSTCLTFLIYSLELPDKCDLSKKDMILNSRRTEAEGLASSTGAKAVSNSWVLNSIAACKLQSFAE